MSGRGNAVRERILDAAVALLRDVGVKKLAQPQVARAAKVPQGHLTYYFPRKADMLAAVASKFLELLAADFEQTEAGPEGRRGVFFAMASKLVKNRTRTRMLLGLVVEADGDEDLRASLSRGARFVRGGVQHAFSIPDNDPDADLALALMWGLGLQQFIYGHERSEEETDALIRRAIAWIDSARKEREGR